MRPNTFRQLLREGRPTFGTHLFTMWPTIVEVVGHTGNFDYIEFSGEYAPYELNQLENEYVDAGQALEATELQRAELQAWRDMLVTLRGLNDLGQLMELHRVATTCRRLADFRRALVEATSQT